ncbi:RES family NAD+ phosphorylase [Aridibaculum aurantiacum]|uniref:RES family NAD+ phosphorylase n=1 Tax=Aridibaculum aurantiacum TaxID=2810307 RepID=UPI001A96C86C|nr:RES family NAD+ phosphorylase [Aridibaculum aurantiacum]
MVVYRFSNKKYSSDLSGTGAKMYGGRWNHKGLAGLYTSSSISLSLLEVLVHALSLEQLKGMALLKLEVPDNLAESMRVLNGLKPHWDEDVEYTRFIGSEFLQNRSFLMLKCPSAVVQEEWNYLLNPLHADYNKLKVLSVEECKFDSRLFKI